MTSKVTIDLDLEVVRRAINAKVAPAVDKILSKIDLEKHIATALTKVADANKKKDADRDRYGLDLRYRMMWGGAYDDGEPIIDKLIAGEIKKAAHAFVVAAVAKERPKIDAAFKHMLGDSKDMIAKTMFAALEQGLKSEWSFSLETKMTPDRKERNDD